MLYRFILVLLTTIITAVYAKGGDVTEQRLTNGLRVIVKEDHRAPVATVQIWYKVGSSYESNGSTGISHALEHMMFRGTKKYGETVLDKVIIGNGGRHNAFTGSDFTAYYETLPVDKLAIAFDLEADRMQGLLLDRATFAKERQVIIEERKMRIEDDPNALTLERFNAAAFVSNPYRSPILGWMHDIQNLTPEDLGLWHKSWYVPNNAIIVVVGDVQPRKIFALAKQYFAKIPSINISLPKPQKEVSPLGVRTVKVKAPAEVPFLIMGYNVPSLKTTEKKWQAYALEVAQGILSSGASARLAKNLVRKQQIAASVSADYDLYSRLDTLLTVNGTPAQGHTVKELRKAILQQIKDLQTTLVSKQELERIKAQVVSAKVYAKDSIEHQAMEIGSLETVGLSWREAERYLKNIQAVTPEQVKAVAAEYLIPDRLTVAELQPTKLLTKK